MTYFFLPTLLKYLRYCKIPVDCHLKNDYL